MTTRISRQRALCLGALALALCMSGPAMRPESWH